MVMVNMSLDQQVVARDHSEEERRLLALVRQYVAPPDDITKIEQALTLAVHSYQDLVDERGILLIEHALEVALILAQMHIDAIGVMAGLLFEAVDADLLPLEQVEEIVGSSTAHVIYSMERFNILERRKQSALSAQKSSEEDASSPGVASSTENKESKKPRVREAMRRQQAETVRKMFVAMAEDPRVVALKLAYRLHTMRYMCKPDYQGDQQELLNLAQETREIYAPLAGRLGMSRIESELEDLAFKILEPEKYEWVRGIVEAESKQWRSYVDRICDVLRKEMKAIGVKAEVSGRVKHLWSFYKKLERNAGDVGGDLEALKAAADVSQIHDLIAFRILVDSTTDCYVALGHVHSLWKPKEGRIKDFIANPKPNGYRALHTTVFCLDDQLVEIQIRTHEMHEMAEYGVAMHWHYKDVGDTASSSAKELLTWIHQLAEWQQELRASGNTDSEFVQAVKDDFFEEQIFVFTPKGEVKDLPVGSTPLDFAYRIHTKIGDKCAGARIITHVEGADGDRLVSRMVPLNYELQSGEIVDIVTNRSAHPTRDWLNFARTAAARNKIRRYLKTHERDINIQIGRERIEHTFKTMNLRGVDLINEEIENMLCSELKMQSFDDILAAVGADDLRAHTVCAKVQEHLQAREPKESKEPEGKVTPPSSTRQAPANLQVAGVEGLLTRLANCCYPLPGDEIVGFISRGKGVIVHRADCQNIARLKGGEKDRLIAVNWTGMSQTRYHAPIIILARDRPDLIRDIATVISEYGINLNAFHTRQGLSREQIIVSATLEINNLEILPRIFQRLEKIKDVLSVERDTGKKIKREE
uniref:(P)ppGpp synthetase n=1 Tax=Thermosporothrix sp. COM3 TaxID=2490863 RepID=A0A455SZ19_9CHLR|nr:(p)ppGpp synthetase [Thermosporothrix sp. COM3]